MTGTLIQVKNNFVQRKEKKERKKGKKKIFILFPTPLRIHHGAGTFVEGDRVVVVLSPQRLKSLIFFILLELSAIGIQFFGCIYLYTL